MGGGTIIDMGVYTIQLCQWVFQKEPISIQATGILNDDGVDLEMSGELKYSGNKIGKMKTSALNTMSCTAKIVGTKGEITVSSKILSDLHFHLTIIFLIFPKILYPFWSSTTIIDVDGTEKSWPFPKTECDFNFPNSCGLRYEIDAVRKCLQSGKIECEYVTHKESLLIARIQDEIRKQVGVKYVEDE